MAPFGFLNIGRERRPLLAIVVINVAVFLICAIGGFLHGRGLIPFDIASFLGLPASTAALAARPWSPLTYMVTHTNPLHLLFNMLWLFWFGAIICTERKPAAVAVIYLTGGIAGAIFYIAAAYLFPSAHTLFGASASILAIMAAAAVIAPNVSFRLFLLGEIRLKWLALICIILAFIGAGGAAFSAHLGGVIAGLLFPRLSTALTKRAAASKQFSPADVYRFKRAVKNSSMRDSRRLDELLDKIRLSGFDSLSAREKDELQSISQRIDPKKRPEK